MKKFEYVYCKNCKREKREGEVVVQRRGPRGKAGKGWPWTRGVGGPKGFRCFQTSTRGIKGEVTACLSRSMGERYVGCYDI